MNKIDKQIKIETAYAIVDGFIERRKNNGDYRLRNEMEYESRDIVCYDIFKKNLSISKSVSALMDRFGIGNSTAYKWLAHAFKQLSKDYKELTEEYKTIQINRLEKLYEMCMEKDNVRDALKVMEQINKLNSLYVDRVEISDINNQFKFGE